MPAVKMIEVEGIAMEDDTVFFEIGDCISPFNELGFRLTEEIYVETSRIPHESQGSHLEPVVEVSRNSIVAKTLDGAKEAMETAMSDDEVAEQVSKAKTLMKSILNGEAGEKLVASVVSALHIMARILSTKKVREAAASSLRHSAHVVRQPVFVETTARCIEVAASALESDAVTKSLANSLLQTAGTLENQTVAATFDAAVKACQEAIERALGLINIAVQNKKLSDVAFQISSHPVVQQSVAKSVEIVESAMETSAVRRTVQTGKYLAKKTLENKTVQGAGKTAIDVALKIASDGRVQTFATKNIEFAATAANAVVNNQGVSTAFRLGTGVASAGISAVGSLWGIASAPLQYVPPLRSRSNQSLDIHETQLRQNLADTLGLDGKELSDVEVIALLRENSEAQLALYRLALEARRSLHMEIEDHQQTTAYATELAEALAAGATAMRRRSSVCAPTPMTQVY